MVVEEELKQKRLLINMILLMVFLFFIIIIIKYLYTVNKLINLIVSMTSLIKEAIAHETIIGLSIKPHLEKGSKSTKF